MALSKKQILLARLAPSMKYSFGNRMNKKIFFLHVHKCGGTSIANSVASTYGFLENLTRKNFGLLSNEASVEAAEIANFTPEEFREHLLFYYMSMPKMKYISGHFCYSERAMEAYGEEWNFITILRDPVSRWFSHYFMDKYKKEKSTYARIDAELDDFIYSDRSLWEARKYVLMFNNKLSLEESTSEEAIRQAIENLKKFSIVGFIDEVENFATDFKNVFGVSIQVPKLNTNPLARSDQEKLITPEIRKKAEEICKPSIKVYEAMRQECTPIMQ
jgi:hypothetical protein